MKKLLILLPLFLSTVALFAQSSAKKYVLLEHFTNSKCSICASKNPAFYSLIGQAQYAPDIHHISIHPPVPYNTCVFYLANTPENVAWANIYGIQGTPRVAVNGNLLPASSQLLRLDTLNKYLGQTSPLYLKVTETGSGSARTAQIEARALSQIPAGHYKLFVAVAEKTINLTTPNGEAVHHDVFRDMLTPVDGQEFIAPAPGQSITSTFNYTLGSGWNASEVYVLAFVKEVDTKQVLNSGTKFDAALSDATEPVMNQLHFSPNPASDAAWVEIADDNAIRTEVYALNGTRVYWSDAQADGPFTIPTGHFVPGIYVVKITGEKGIYTGKLIKD